MKLLGRAHAVPVEHKTQGRLPRGAWPWDPAAAPPRPGPVSLRSIHITRAFLINNLNLKAYPNPLHYLGPSPNPLTEAA